jgi:hypothetical protein
METFARLIHKTTITYLPTNFPVHYYGLPDGKVYVIYARFYEIKFQRSGLEFVLAEHLEFSYNYAEAKLASHAKTDSRFPVYPEMVDKPNPKIKIIKVNRGLNSFAEAFAQLNKKAKSQLNKQPENIEIVPNSDKDQLSIA